MSLEFRNFTARLSALGKKIISTDPKSPDFLDEMLLLVTDLEVSCSKFRKLIDAKRSKND